MRFTISWDTPITLERYTYNSRKINILWFSIVINFPLDTPWISLLLCAQFNLQILIKTKTLGFFGFFYNTQTNTLGTNNHYNQQEYWPSLLKAKRRS